MTYKSAIEGADATGASVIHSDSSHPESLDVADAELLFRGDYHRAGPDLVLTGHDGRHHVIPGYFASEQHPVLVAPNGARLTPDIVDLLAGSPTPGQYAQAQPTAPADPIGKVEKVVGDVHVLRNGVSVTLNVGDLVYKSDVIQTGANSSAGIGFPDGTALDLVANTRMALNEYSFEPNAPSDNSALFTLVEGGFAFVAGQVAHNATASGGMKIATPVATVGIRGTAGYALEQVAAVTANVGNVTFTFAVVADPGTDHVGSYVLIDQFGNEVAVNQAGIWTNVSLNDPTAPPSITQTAMTTANFAIEAQLVPELVNILNNLPPSDFKQGPNPQAPDSHGSSTPPSELNGSQGSGNNGPQLFTGAPIGTPSGPATATFTVISNSSSNSNNNNTLPSQPQENTGTDQWVGASPGPFNSGPNWSSGVPTGTEPVVINAPQGFVGPFIVTVPDSEAAASLTLGVDVILDILTGGSFTVASGISNSGTVLLDSSGGDPALMINGTVDLLDGGTIQMQGPAANLIIGVANTQATLVNVNNMIIGSGSIGQGDGNLTFVNGSLGVVEAKALLAGDPGVLAINTGNTFVNAGLTEATNGGILTIDDPVSNSGTLAANGGILHVVGPVSGSGSATISGGGTLELGGADAQTVTFADASTLKLDNPASFTGQIDGLAVGDIIDLSETAVTKAVIAGSTVTVTESNGSQLIYQIAAAAGGSLSNFSFSPQSDNDGGTDLVLTTAPTVTALTDVTSTGTADLNAGKSITFTLDASEVVNANGAALTLSNGASALYTSGTGTQALTFTYTVAAGDTNTADLKVTGYTGTLADTAGNALVAAGVTEDTGVAINTTAPTVTALTDVTSTGTADLNAGKSITFTLDASEVVNANGAALTLSNGASALYTSGTGTQALTFTYTVAAGDTNTADLKVTGYTGTLADTAGNALVAAGVTEDTGVAINTTAPTVTALTDVTSTGTADLNAGKSITFTLDASEVVNANGAALTLSNGASALYTSGTGTQALTFTYTVAAGDTNTADLKVTGYTGTLADTAGNALVAAGVTEDTGVAINTTAPTVTALTDVTSTGTADLNAGKSITFTLDASEVVNANGAALTLSNGASALYTSGTGTQALTFTYTVAAGDTNTADLKVTGYTGTLADTAGNALVAAGVTEDTGVAINTTAPTVTISSTGGATNQASQTISGTVTENLVPVGTTVDLFDTVNGSTTATLIGTATVNSSGGNWTTSTPVLLAAGINSIVAEDTDAAGNAGVSAPAVVYTLNTTSDQWINANGGSWYDGTNASIDWAFGIPLSGEDVSISTATSSNVTVGNDTLVNTLATVSGSTLEITGGSFTISDGTGTNGNAGTVLVDGGASLQLTGTIIDSGEIWIDSQNSSAATLVINGRVSLQGSGLVQLDPVTGSPQDFIFGSVSGGTLDNFSTIAGAGNIGNNGDGKLTLINDTGGVIDATNPNFPLVIDTGNQVANKGTLEASGGGDLTVRDPLDNEGGSVSIQDGTVELGVTNGLTANFTATGGTLQLDNTVTSGAAAGVDATSTGTAAMTITGVGNVSSSGADGIDATSAGGNITIMPGGSVSGAGNGIFATQDGAGNVTISVESGVTITGSTQFGIEALSEGTGNISVSTTTGDTIDSGGAGILAENQATTIPSDADNSITVTANGTINSGTSLTPAGNRPAGILAGYYAGGLAEPGVTGAVTVDNFANITALAGDGIRAFNYGAGDVTITDEANTAIQTTGANGQYGIEGYSTGAGNISVTTSVGDTVESAGSGINAVNQATAIAQSANSSITVETNGIIVSGTTVNTESGSRPAGILAGYEGGTADTPNAAVFGDVTVTNDANITAAAGDGIRAYNYGTGNVTVTDEANTTIQTTGAQGQYGIEGFSDGVGSVSVTTSAGDTIDSSGTGILAVNEAAAIPSDAESGVTVTAYGTINSGTQLNTSGSAPAGILAGYNPGGNSEPDANVNGSVTVNNFANITASAGWGIDAFNYGNGNVTVNDNYGAGAAASTTVSGAQYGIGAYALSGGIGDVTVNIGPDATISTSNGSAALFGIDAFTQDVGNITVLMSAGDVVTSGSAGVVAVSSAATNSALSTITVTAAGTINSGTNTQPDGFPAAGILTGYDPNSESPDSNVHGNVIVTSDATINAASGFGIWAFNFGTGNVTITTEAGSSITASGPSETANGVSVPVGIGAYASGGGSASITNNGNVTVANGSALQAQASNGGESTGTATITNSGVVLGNGLDGGTVVDIDSDPGGFAMLTNSAGGEIAPVSLSAFSSASDLAIFASGGPITIDNSGTIIGQVLVADAAFNNESTGIWEIGGASGFGGGSGNTIDNAGVIDAVGVASITDVVLTTETTGTVEAFASGTLTLFLNSGSWNYGLTDADGGQITANVELSTGNLGTVEAANGGTSTTNVDDAGTAGLGGNYGTFEAITGGTVDINGGSVGFLNGSAAFALSVFGTDTAPNGAPLGNGMIEALSGGTVDFTGSVTNAVDATIQAVGLGSTVTVADSISDGSAINNSGTIAASNGASVSITAETLTNNPGGVISSTGPGSSVSITEGSDTNNGTVEATGGGSVTVSENADGSVNNATVEATDGGILTIEHNDVIGTNAATGVIEALNGGIVTLDDNRSDVNDGVIEAANGGIVNLDLALDELADGGSGPAGGNFGMFWAMAGGTINVEGGSTIDNGGRAAAIGYDATVDFSNTLADTAVENLGQIFAQEGGTVSFNDVLISDGPSPSGGGEFEANDGTLFVGSNSTLEGATPFNIVINADGVAEFDSLASITVGTDHKIDVTFDGAGTFALAVAPLSAATVTLTDFGAGDSLDLKNLTFSTEESVLVSGNTLTIAGEQFTLAGTEPTNGQVVLISDPFGGTEAVFGTADVWTAGTGDWNASNFENWNSGSGPVPTLLNTAEITTSGITVTLDDTETVGNLVLGAPGAGGPTLEIGTGASLLESSALDIYGGQISIDAGASLTVLGPIDNQGSITLNNQGDAANPATLTLAFGANHDTIGTLQDTGDNSIVNAEGTETLDNGTLFIGSTLGSHLINDDPLGTGAALVLGPNLIVDQTGMAQIASTNATTAIDDEVVSFATINTSAGSTFFIQPDFFTNHGDINANQSGATLDIIPTGWFTNFGTVAVSGGQTAQIENGFFSATQPEGVTNEAGGVISVDGVGSSLSIDSSTFDNSGVVEATNGGQLQIEDAVNNSGTGALMANGGTVIVQGAVTGNGTSTISNSGLLDFQSSVSADQGVDFTGAGTLKIDAPASFGAAINMAHSDPGEILDLGGLNSQAGDTFTTSTSFNGTLTTLTVTDQTQGGTSESVNLVGDFTSATWTVTVDGSGGADVSDPPATHPPGAQNPAETTTGTMSVSIGGPGSDNFIFAPGIGADTIVNFNPQADTIELEHFANLQNVQQLAALVTPDAHGDAVIEHGHNDSITLPGVTQSYLQAHLQSLVHLG